MSYQPYPQQFNGGGFNNNRMPPDNNNMNNSPAAAGYSGVQFQPQMSPQQQQQQQFAAAQANMRQFKNTFSYGQTPQGQVPAGYNMAGGGGGTPAGLTPQQAMMLQQQQQLQQQQAAAAAAAAGGSGQTKFMPQQQQMMMGRPVNVGGASGSPVQSGAQGFPQQQQHQAQSQLHQQQQPQQQQPQPQPQHPQQVNVQGHPQVAAAMGAGGAAISNAPSPQIVNPNAPNTNLNTNNASAMEPSSPDEILKVVNELDDGEEANNEKLKQLKHLISKDAKYAKVLKKQESNQQRSLKRKQIELEYYNQIRNLRQQQPNVIFQEGYSGYGNGWTMNKARLIYPRERKRSRRQAKELFLTDEQEDVIANAEEILVPIRLDFDADKFRLRDTFTWNISEKAVPIQLFAENLLEDFSVPLHYTQALAKSISEQLNDYYPHVYCSDKMVASDYKDSDMRIVIKLDITIGQHNLVDQFEWDMNCPENSPEEFAEIMCNELSLSGEFKTAIAHAIREQTQLHTKSLFLIGHSFDGSMIEDDDIRREICPMVMGNDFIRPKTLIKDFSPVLFEIPESELERQDKDRERDSRRKRRQGRAGRRGGPTLPDLKEAVRTFRTPVYSAILPGGIDKNVEILRKQARTEDSDDDSEEYMSSATTTRSTRRGRQAAYAAQAAIAGQQQEFNGGSPRFSSPGVGRSAMQQQRMANELQQQQYLQQQQFIQQQQQQQQQMQQQLHQQRMAAAAQGTPGMVDEAEPTSYMVKLKVPRLGQFLNLLSKRPNAPPINY